MGYFWGMDLRALLPLKLPVSHRFIALERTFLVHSLLDRSKKTKGSLIGCLSSYLKR
jgi:hypothetical protein